MEMKLSLVVPCYNEEDVLPTTIPLFRNQLFGMSEQTLVSPDSKLLLVNDGSKDNTWKLICEYAENDESIIGITLSRNRGHQNALLAGLMEAKDSCDIAISIDADGQDDIKAMTSMVKAYLNGADVVYGVRASRKSDKFFKRFTAESYYKFLSLMGADIIYNHADYRLLSNKVLKELASFKEVNLFLRGIVPLIGFNSTCIYYERHERMAGKSHYPLNKMISLAIEGITSLSTKLSTTAQQSQCANSC